MKHMLKSTFQGKLPANLLARRDKMGFPVPLTEWYQSDLRDYVLDTFASTKSQTRDTYNAKNIGVAFQKEATFSRKTWAFLNLEIWQQQFHDQHSKYKQMLC